MQKGDLAHEDWKESTKLLSFYLWTKALSVLSHAGLSTAYLSLQVLAISLMGTNGIRIFLQYWEKGHSLPQFYLGVEMLDIMLML